ncbi:hypothetical protein BVG16_05660 [Paenibacillus selenitireducens]|uniref:Uncharacterized protein n=2 Tax=Paenibacillus selenitireducens TaxID=1324314 RepID=A0A1T2XK35_9BACL|nr:hypothetical protein BVG16_05660 [Paenibacillus selenitireducens]
MNGSDFWHEGLAPEEIEEMKPVPVPDPIEMLGEQMVQRELEAHELRTQNEVLGNQIVEKDLQILDLKAQNDTISGNVTALELRLLELEAKADV